jgi:predicted N-acyltransferase
VKLRVLRSLADIDAPSWDACANPAGQEFNPFVSHAFLKALEDSGSASRETGWLGQHLILDDDAGSVVGAVPCYRKSHSYGEYVFDHGWADAFERAGGRYYPKLQVSVPFTPATGPRLLARDDRTKLLLADGLRKLCEEQRASSIHMTFLPEADWKLLGGRQWLQRMDVQFHWHNHSYGSFQDFLASLSARKRKNIRKERDAVSKSGISCAWVTGSDLTEAHWNAFFRFYMDTGSRKWGSPYLTREFFSLIGESMADRILLVMCKRAGRIIAGALNFIGSNALYGRNWGAVEHHPCLHFEACYYQAIEFAIDRKLARVEAGAQGPHKLARGYLPQTTYSLHHFAHRGLAQAVGQYLEQERAAIIAEERSLAEFSPFRHAVEADGV